LIGKDVVGFTREQLDSQRGRTVPDLIGPDVRLLFVGINPGLWTAAAQSHFARRGNRFYPALFQAGITDRIIDASAGYTEDDLAQLHERGIGITNLVPTASARADELGGAELRAGAEELRRRVAQLRPAVVAVLGISAYRVAFGERRAATGKQQADLSGAQLWVLPNPSGLNAHDTVGSLALAYRHAAQAAGIALYQRDDLNP
jgi:TDG/mug DNA glycosylase family protein